MVTYSPIRVAAFTVIIVLLIQKVPKLFRLLRRKGLKTLLIQKLSRFLLKFSYFRNKYIKKDQYVRESLQHLFLSTREDPILSLPPAPLPNLLHKLQSFALRDQKLQHRERISGSLYHTGESLNEVATAAMKLFTFSNPLHPDIFPSVRQMESELVQITVNLFNGTRETCGVLTTGGTESLLLAVLAYREWGRRRGIDEPEIIVPDTIHAAVDKAAYYFNVTLVKVRVEQNTRKVSPREVRKQITSATVAIIASAPNFPNGIIDPLEELGNLALLYGINFHVDACLGGFMIPFMEECGFGIEKCDFRLKGVTSISVDLHKYAYTPKGVSVLMFCNNELRRLAYFSSPEWTGGVYVTPTMAGTRSGVISAGAWAVVMSLGRSGYVECTAAIMRAARYIKEEASKIENIRVVGDPLMSVLAFESDTLNIHAIGNAMTRVGGWAISHVQNPDGIHLTVTYANAKQAEDFVEDMKKAVLEVEIDPEAEHYETAALYGMVHETVDKSLVGDISKHFADCLFTA
jgi:sphinganine-1-phosphate aldolase